MSVAAPSESAFNSLLGASWAATPELDFSGRRLAKIVDVYDGDTCTAVFWFGGNLVRSQLRLEGFDSPEMRAGRGRQLEPGEKEKATVCRDALRALVLNRIVAVEFGPSDKYGRALARIHAGVLRGAADDIARLAAVCGGGPEASKGIVSRAGHWLRDRIAGSASAPDRDEAREVLAQRLATAAAEDLPRTTDLRGRGLDGLLNINLWMLAKTCSVPYAPEAVAFSVQVGARLSEAAYAEMRAATRESTTEFELVGSTFAKIIKVYDGDTCTAAFEFNDRVVRVNIRTAGYDSPEMRAGRGRELEPGEKEKAVACRDALRALILNRIVVVDFLSNPDHHNYGRALGRIHARVGSPRARPRGNPLIGGGASAPECVRKAAAVGVADLGRRNIRLGGLLNVNEWMLKNTDSVAYSV